MALETIQYAEAKIDFSHLELPSLDKHSITDILETYDASELTKLPMLAKYIAHRTKELEEKAKKDAEAQEKQEYILKQIHAKTPEERKENAKERLRLKLASRALSTKQ